MKLAGEVTGVKLIQHGFQQDEIELDAMITGGPANSGSSIKLFLPKDVGGHRRIGDAVTVEVCITPPKRRKKGRG